MSPTQCPPLTDMKPATVNVAANAITAPATIPQRSAGVIEPSRPAFQRHA